MKDSKKNISKGTYRIQSRQNKQRPSPSKNSRPTSTGQLNHSISTQRKQGTNMCRLLENFLFLKEDQKKHKKMKWNEMPKRCELCKSKRTERLANQRGKLDSKERNICYAFQAGECPFGASCKFSHNPNHAGGKRSNKPIRQKSRPTTDD